MGRRTIWTPEMDKALREIYPKRGGQAAADRLRMSVEQVWQRAAWLGLKAPHGRGAAWTPDEDDMMREHYLDLGVTGLIPMLKGRTHVAIENRAFVLGLGRRLKSNGDRMVRSYDHRALAEALGMADREPPSLARMPARVHRILGAGL
jgi:hypothetical protein